MQSIFGAGGFAGQALSQFGSVLMDSLPVLTGVASDIYGMWDSNRRFEAELNQQKIANAFAEKQFAETQKANEWNRFLSENGVQIRANDLAKAGLSKTLASGSAPSYVTGYSGGQMINGSFGQGFKATALLQALQMKKNFQRQDAEISLLKAQEQNVKEQNAGIKLDNVNKEIKNKWDDYEANYWISNNSHPQSNTWVKLFAEALGQRSLTTRSANFISNFITDTFGTFKHMFEWIKGTKVSQTAIDLIANGFKTSKAQAKRFIEYMKRTSSVKELMQKYDYTLAPDYGM